jgi:L-ascorbate metabolism protein UlaG (beta-lactamase superfamily)
MEHPTNAKRWPRRVLLGGLGVAGMTGAGAMLYRAAPSFWRQYMREFGRPIAAAPVRPDPRRWPDRGLFAAWLGHATVLIRIDGFTILTDPVFSDRAGLNLGPFTLGVKRLVAPAVALESLPKIDLVLLSHAHMDHFDIPSLRRLESRATEVVTARGTSDLLRPARYGRVQELGWEETAHAGPAEVRAFRVNHWGARMRSDTWRGYNAYTIAAGRWRVLFAGDTADTDAFRHVRGAREFHLAIMPIGAYNPWIRYHCTPEQAWRMGNEAGAEQFLPIHHQTFTLSREPYGEPITRFLDAAGPRPERVPVRRVGDEFRLT